MNGKSNNINSGLTLTDVREVLMQTISDLRTGKTDVKIASEIRNLSNSMIDIAKTQIEFLKAIPESVKSQINLNEVKAIAGTLIDRDAELDYSLKQIEENKNKPYTQENF